MLGTKHEAFPTIFQNFRTNFFKVKKFDFDLVGVSNPFVSKENECKRNLKFNLFIIILLMILKNLLFMVLFYAILTLSMSLVFTLHICPLFQIALN